MKKCLFAICFVFFITGLAAAQIGPGRTLYVSVKTVDLKSSKGLLAGKVATLQYGDQVTVIQTDGKFVEVKSDADSSLSGWTAADNFTTKRIVSGNAVVGSAKEIALAGKGFSQEVENSYKTQGELNYADVDRVEMITADETELLRFLKEGRLATGE